MGRRRKSKGKARVKRQDPQNSTLSMADENTIELQRLFSARKSSSTAAEVAHNDITSGGVVTGAPSGSITPAEVAHNYITSGGAVTGAPSGAVTPAADVSRIDSPGSTSPAPPTPKFLVAENLTPPQPSIPAAALAAGAPFEYASRWDAPIQPPDPASTLGARKLGSQQDSVPPAPAAQSTRMAGACTTGKADDTNAAVVVANAGGPLSHKPFPSVPVGASSPYAFFEPLRTGCERDPTSWMTHRSDLTTGFTDLFEPYGVIKPAGPTGRQVPGSVPSPPCPLQIWPLQHLRSALGWAAWAAAHVYTGWLAWRIWAQHESMSLTGDRCPDDVLLAIMLLALHSYTALLLLRKVGLWRVPLADTFIAAGNFISDAMKRHAYIKPVLWTVCFAALLVQATRNSSAAMEGPICAAGQVVLVAGCCAYSRHPASIRWTIPLSALLAHHLLALLFVHLGAGLELLSCVQQLIQRLTSFSQLGAARVLGYLSTGETVGWGEPAPISFAYVVLPAVLYLGALANLLLHYGLVSPVIAKTGWLAHHVFGITSCEAIVALANVFFGQVEAPLLVLPYLARMTRSELHCLMTVGFATMSSAVLPVLTRFNLRPVDVTISPILSTLAAIASSKLLYPETEYSVTAHYNLEGYRSPAETYVEALASGTDILVAVVPAIAFSLVAFLSAGAFVSDVCADLGRLVSVPGFTPHAILTALLEPVVLLMGIGLHEVHLAARLLATALLSNEVVAYQGLSSYAANGGLSVRTHRVLTFALCGFANVGSLGVVFAVLSIMAPNRAFDVASIGFSAMVAGCVANYLTACTVGTIIATTAANPPLGKFNATDFLEDDCALSSIQGCKLTDNSTTAAP